MIEAWIAEHWDQLAGTGWRYYLAHGRGLLIVTEGVDRQVFPARYLQAADVRNADVRAFFGSERSEAISRALAQYDPQASVVLAIVAGAYCLLQTVSHQPPPPLAHARQGN